MFFVLMIDNDVDCAPLGFRVDAGIPFHRALPYAIEYKAFSLFFAQVIDECVSFHIVS
jgi:hypothetical protein